MKTTINKGIVKLIYLFTLLSVTGIGYSCAGFLEEVPEAKRSSNNFYKDETSLETGVNGLYYTLKDYYNSRVALVGELGVDECYSNVAHGFGTLSGYKYTADNSEYVEGIYRRLYQLVTRATTVINRSQKLPETDNVRRMIAEAKALRAWGYFQLVQIYGPVAIVNEEVTSEVDFSIPRSPIKDVYAQIIKDFTEAGLPDVLPDVSAKGRDECVSRYAVKALMAKVYLTMASYKETGKIDALLSQIGRENYGYGAIDRSVSELYDDAAKYCDTVMMSGIFNLCEQYSSPFCFDNRGQYKNENLWELIWGSQEPVGGNWLKYYGYQVNYGAGQDLRRLLSNGGGYGQLIYTENIWNAYKKGDTRKSWNLGNGCFNYDPLNPDKNTSDSFFDPSDDEGYGRQDDYRVIKFRFNDVDSLWAAIKYTDKDNLPITFPMVRYADVLLMYAEALLKANGGTATRAAVDAVNEVRARARGYDVAPEDTPDFPEYTIADLTFDKVFEERKLELCFEAHRKFDCMRIGQMIEKYYEPEYPDKFRQDPTLVDQEYKYLFPIPLSQIDASMNKEGFFQNPGYGNVNK